MKRKLIHVEHETRLSPDVKKFLFKLPALNADLGKAVLESIDYAREQAPTFPIYSPHETLDENQKIIAVTLLIRLIDLVEATVILAAYDVKQEVQSLFRMTLDAYFLIGNVCEDASFVEVYVKTDEVRRHRLMNVVHNHDHEMFQSVRDYVTKERKSDLKKKINEEGIQRFNSEEYAKKIGCAHVYDSWYRIMSSSVHTSPKCLEDYFEADASGYVIAVRQSKDMESVPRILSLVGLHLLKALQSTSELFEKIEDCKIVELEEKIRKADS